ncbi:putative DNA replication initiation factor cdc45 [Rosellinia necatrix]|uniref:Putative DNA replication initiation factor cdc45 n=1 Tax=Rosellinia necatrix TaxID=77044 RepID=A0A1W2TTS8_ROSNE|nr:putative DNA replication initiation factor cdc45 [Rosellinia necatrix]
MGIQGLGPAVRRLGNFNYLRGESFVIDGPALVHQILHGFVRRRPRSNAFICSPTYARLGQALIEWLDELQAYNVTVRKIYFDGYLPPTKWLVRKQRLLDQSRIMRDLLNTHPYGSPKLPADAFDIVKSEIALTHNIHHRRWLPLPPFLVPAVIEILRSCQTWGPLVEVVPGEADMFCAEDVRRHGGVILTNDSDLLITDLGRDGTMSFLHDLVAVDRWDKSQGLMTRKFSLHAINDALGIGNVGGLPRVAFQTITDRINFPMAIHQVRCMKGNDLKSPEFRDFMEEYSMKEYLPIDHPVKKILSDLDPRISEIVIQTLLLGNTKPMQTKESSGSARGPDALAMFLPVMIEDRSRKSAWTMSTAVRQLAYSVIQNLTADRSPTIIEYRLLESSDSMMGGRKIDVPDPEETLELCRVILDTVKKLAKHIHDSNVQWLALAIYQDVLLSASTERSPLFVSLLNDGKIASDSGEEHSWDIIHASALAHASLYSLRMVKQALDVAALLNPPLSPELQEMQECLCAFPPITEWPTVETMPQALAAANEANVLFILTNVLDALVTEPPGQPVAKKPRKRSRTGLLRSEINPNRPVSVNPFSILGDSKMD